MRYKDRIGTRINEKRYTRTYKRIGHKIITKQLYPMDNLIIYEAWEPSELAKGHSTIMSIDREWYGKIGTRDLPPELESLPAMSRERFEAVNKWYKDQYEEAYNLIIKAFPEAKAGKRNRGEILLRIS